MHSKKVVRSVLSVIFCLLVVARIGRAEVFQAEFTGTVSTFRHDSGYSDYGISVGDIVSGAFSANNGTDVQGNYSWLYFYVDGNRFDARKLFPEGHGGGEITHTPVYTTASVSADSDFNYISTPWQYSGVGANLGISVLVGSSNPLLDSTYPQDGYLSGSINFSDTFGYAIGNYAFAVTLDSLTIIPEPSSLLLISLAVTVALCRHGTAHRRSR